MDHKLVVVARKDVKMGPGKLAAQVGHASVDCAMKVQRRDAKTYRAWLDGGQKKVVVKAQDVDTLFELKEVAERMGITTSLIRDAGHTQIASGTITVLGIGPAPEEDVDKIAGHLPLY